MERRDLTQRILQLTLHIIYLLTGEDYGPIKKENADHVISSKLPCEPEGWRRSQSPTMKPPSFSLTPEKTKEQKILDVTNKIIELLTGEVAIRSQDVAVYLSMEEREYLEGHCERYKAAMMEEEPPLTSPDGSRKRNFSERCPRPLYSQDSAQEEHSTPQEDQHVHIMAEASADLEEETPDVQIKEEEISPQISTDTSDTANNMETLIISKDGNYITEGFPGEDLTAPDLHPTELSYSPSTQVWWFPDHPPPASHQNVHPAGEMFLYSAHGNCSAQKAELLSHQRGREVENRIFCSESGKHFSLLQRDQMKHGRVMPFSCSECGKCFAHKSDFLEHKGGHARVKPFSCPKCRKCFSQRGHLLSHQRTHLALTPFSCFQCGECFSQRDHLLSHERTHQAQRKFTCSKCGKCYTKKSSLTTHEKIHMGLKPYICSSCGKCFTRKTLLNLHERVHTGEKPYSCSECGRCFSQRPHLVSHRRTHLGKSRNLPT